MTFLSNDLSGVNDQISRGELAASVKQMSEYLSRDCAAAGLDLMAHLLAMVALEAQDVIESVDPNWSRSANLDVPVARLG